MKKLINISLILVVLLNNSCVKIENEISDSKYYDLDGSWELYEGKSDIKRIDFEDENVVLKSEDETIQGKLGTYITSTSSIDLFIFSTVKNKKIPSIEYYNSDKKVEFPIYYERLDDKNFITINDDVYQKIK
ncbi:hypothetical protein INR75_16140 [Zunongwangia sp. SCSIO 43204]|uniref:hypothetical protein n=1 Tax=Zunongwangia sp. SCSIO 43204 TaxID=2779359 RepID=UPI001CA843AC|nr:hypothetical protein [Zunongwangia sp. SCSIO 43204]UAB83687.1 hypothetical protein INR75_16140 [Zunongwangia sp. SCSIO 43204]